MQIEELPNLSAVGEVELSIHVIVAEEPPGNELFATGLVIEGMARAAEMEASRTRALANIFRG